MHFQLRTDNHVTSSEKLTERVRAEVEAAVAPRFSDRLHRIEVYLQDLNSHKGGIDTRCAIEAHLSGHQPVAVSAEAAGLDEAVGSAVEKLTHALEHTLGKLAARGGRTSASGQES